MEAYLFLSLMGFRKINYVELHNYILSYQIQIYLRLVLMVIPLSIPKLNLPIVKTACGRLNKFAYLVYCLHKDFRWFTFSLTPLRKTPIFIFNLSDNMVSGACTVFSRVTYKKL